MNRPIRRVAVVVALLFAILAGNLTYTVLVRHDALRSSPYNARVRDAQYAQDRGAILVGSTPIADTKASGDHYDYQRFYPEGRLWAPVTGYFSYDYGSTALERAYSDQLSGTSDSQAISRWIDQLAGRTPKGASILTTLDAKVQRAAVAAMGQNKGAIVALDPQTGAIRALVTTPTFDPNALASHDFAAARQAAQALEKDPHVPLTNRAVREIYPPGSTFKLVTTAAALEAGKKPDTLVDTPDALRLPNSNVQLGNQSPCGNTKITLDRALQLSCNTAFANLAMELGEEAMANQAAKFGFGEAQLADLRGVASSYPRGMDAAQLAMTGIGQFDVTSTPLQMAMVAGAIANNGVLMKPYLVAEVKGPNLQTLSRTTPTRLGDAMKPENARLLQQMMVNVVTKGSGQPAAVAGVATGGKTGTAEHGAGLPPYGWYVAFGPQENARIAVAVFVEASVGFDAYAQEHAGYSIAAPIAQKVLQAALG